MNTFCLAALKGFQRSISSITSSVNPYFLKDIQKRKHSYFEITNFEIKQNLSFFFTHQELIGNENTFAVKSNPLTPNIEARYVKLKPLSWSAGGICTSFDLFGCSGTFYF